MSKPTLVLVPCLWAGPSVYNSVIPALNAQGYETHIAPLSSTGHPASTSPKSPTVLDDIAVAKTIIAPHVEAGKTVVVVTHSAGGFVGAAAIEGLLEKDRKAQGKTGGVRSLAFICSAPMYTGYDQPFFEFRGAEMHCVKPRELLFNDIASDEEAERHIAGLKCQPASGYDGEVNYYGWKDVPSKYLVCEKDAAFPPPVQRQLAELVGAKVESVDAGHMVPITKPEKVVEFIVGAVGS